MTHGNNGISSNQMVSSHPSSEGGSQRVLPNIRSEIAHWKCLAQHLQCVNVGQQVLGPVQLQLLETSSASAVYASGRAVRDRSSEVINVLKGNINHNKE